MPPVSRPIPRTLPSAPAPSAFPALPARGMGGKSSQAGAVARKYLGDKFLDGISIGLVFAVLVSFEPHGHLRRFLDEFLVSIHPVAGLLGFIAALCYPRLNNNFLKKMCSSWFDLTQQFFTLAAGAWLPVLVAGKVAAKMGAGAPVAISFTEIFSWLVMLALAMVLGGLWAIRDMHFDYRKSLDFGCIAAIAVASILIGFSLKNPRDGGRQFMVDSARSCYLELERTGVRAWKQMSLRLPQLGSLVTEEIASLRFVEAPSDGRQK